ncbi:MAG TPA: SirB1 family protein [Xanthomonadaceae bacterium]|nr:SirB1 family protein [Xanthomonadaceae bacterium]
MPDALSLPDWTALASVDDADLPLFGTALLIARDEYPQLDPGLYDRLAQDHADALREEIQGIGPSPLKMHAINRHLFEELGYSGNTAEYYDPRNSYLNEVFERRLGNPLSLALVQIEVARRLDVQLDGVSFPGHFLVRLPVGDEGVLVMDPFNRGRPLDVDELKDRAKPHLGGTIPDDNALNRILDPASNRAMLVRLLRNLHGVYSERDDWPRAARSADRILQLQPDHPEALRDRALAYLKMGHRHGARRDLELYLQRNPKATDRGSLRERLVELNREQAWPH